MLIKIFWSIRLLMYSIVLGKVGHSSYMGKPIIIKNGRKIAIGNRVRIYPGARLEVYGTEGSIQIEDDVSIGQNLHMTSGGKLVIKSGTLITENVCITNIEHNYDDVNKSAIKQELVYQNTKIGNNCFIGSGACILAGTSIGSHCIIGANSVVKGTFPDFCVIAGAPAKIVKTYDPKLKEWKKIK